MDDLLVLVKGKSASDPLLRAVRKKVQKGTADFNDTAQYSEALSKLIGKNLSANILDIPPDVREELSTELLEYGYTDINELLNDVQISLDEKNGIHIRPQRADFPTERVEQFVHSLIDPTVDDSTIKRRARAGSETITKSFHDDYMKKNAAFRSDAGLKCYIVRTAAYKCCEWCSNIAGRYPYDVWEMPEDIFRRHDNCDCRTILENGRERQDVWTKRTWEVPETGPGAESPAVFTEEQAKAIEQRNLQQFSGVKINNSSIDNSGGSSIIEARELDSLIVSNNGTEVPKDVKTAIEETVSVIPEHLRSRLEQFVPEIIVEEGRGFSSFTSDNNIILDKETATQSILHELGHAWAKMDNLYEDEEFLAILADGLDREDWGNVIPYKHPYKDVNVYVLESDKFVVPYQGRVYADIFSVDYSEPIELSRFKEYISVGFDKFFSDPDLLKLKDPKLYKYLEGKINE